MTGPRLLRGLVLDELDAPKVTGASYVSHNRKVLELFESVAEVVLVREHVLQDFFVFHDLDARQGDRTRHGVTRPGEAVNERIVVVLERFGDAVRDNHGAQRGVARGDPLRAGDDVGHVVVLLGAEPGAQATESADHVVRHQQDAVTVTD